MTRMQMPKHTDAAKDYFRTLVPQAPGVEVKPMFGSLGAFINGNMFAGLFGEDVGVKLDEAALTEAKTLPGSGPFGPAERPMNGWVSLPAHLADAAKTEWFARALDHIATLPPKVKKAAKAKPTLPPKVKTAAKAKPTLPPKVKTAAKAKP